MNMLNQKSIFIMLSLDGVSEVLAIGGAGEVPPDGFCQDFDEGWFFIFYVPDDVAWGDYEQEVNSEDIFFQATTVAPDEQDSVAVHKIFLEGAFGSYGYGFLMVDEGLCVDPDVEICSTDMFAPVHFFVVEKKVFCHEACFGDGGTADKHGGAVGEACGAGAVVVLAIVFLVLPDAFVAGGVVVHGRESGVLEDVGLVEVANFGRDNAYVGVGVEGGHELFYEAWGEFCIVVDEEEVVAFGDADADVVATGEACIFF